MKQIVLVKGDTPEQFVDAFNEVCSNLKFVDSYELITPTVAYVFYEIEEPEEEKPKYVCADCDNYDWGKGCDFCEGVIRPLHPSCEYFNVEVPVNEEVQS